MSMELVGQLLRRPIAYHPVFRHVSGSTVAAVMLSQMYYWSTSGRIPADRDGWFYKSGTEWESETGLSRSEQDRARRDLIKVGVLKEVRKGHPARLWFRLDVDRVNALVAQFAESCNQTENRSLQNPAIKKDAESCVSEINSLQSTSKTEVSNKTTSLRNPANCDVESCKQERGILQSSLRNPANIKTETTAEITPETTDDGDACDSLALGVSDQPTADHFANAGKMVTDPNDPLFTDCQPAPFKLTGNRQRFAMHFEWEPSALFAERCQQAGVSPSLFRGEQAEAILGEFRSYWNGQGDELTQGAWEHKLVNHLKRQIVHGYNVPTARQQRQAVTESLMDIQNTDW